MRGMMMDRQLRIIDLLLYGADTYAEAGITSVAVEGTGLHRESYAQMLDRAARMAQALRRMGVGEGDRVATLAWNGYRHMELYYAIPGIGAICHTLNPRLSAEQMIYIVNHASDKVMFLDLTFVPLAEALAQHFPPGMAYVIMTDAAHMPQTKLGNVHCYEDLLTAEDGQIDWPEFDENSAAGLCYTSGTTGNPKGALYSQRSQVLHAHQAGLSPLKSLHAGSRILPVVPLFHANSWGLAHAAPLTGTSLVMPGPALDGKSLWDLMQSEAVFSAWGVPTVWLGLMAEITARGAKPDALQEVVIGGAAAAPSLIESYERHGIDVCHAWGMTEMSPVGTLGVLGAQHEGLSFEERLALKSTQGRRTYLVDLKIVDEEGNALPHDGKATGEMHVRGPFISKGYFNNPEASEAAIDAEGWFGTGDVAWIDAEGFLRITDRAKDLIKSGGEWISSIDVENLALGHDHIANCAVIAVPHPKWDERPILIVVPSVKEPDPASIRAHLAQHLAKWQLPDDIVFVEDLPLTATGKVSKLTLRERFKDHALASD